MHYVKISANSDGSEAAMKLAPEIEEAREELTLADQLEEAGLTQVQIAAVLAVVEAETERQSFHRAAQVLRVIFRRVASFSTAGAALAHAVGLTENRPLSELAREFGASKQAIGNRLPTLGRLLGPLATTQAKAETEAERRAHRKLTGQKVA